MGMIPTAAQPTGFHPVQFEYPTPQLPVSLGYTTTPVMALRPI